MLERQLVLDSVTGTTSGNLANVGKVRLEGQSIQNIMMNAIQSILVTISQSDRLQQAIQVFDALESEVLCKNRFTSQASRWGLHLLVLADEWGNDEKHICDEAVAVNTIPQNTEKWLRKFYMKTMATRRAMRTK